MCYTVFMKKLIPLLLIPLFFISCVSTDMPKVPMDDSYLVVEVPNATKDKLWGRVNSWCLL